MIIRPRRIRTKVLGYIMSPFTSSIDIGPGISSSSPIYTAIPSSPASTISSIDPSSPRSTISEMSSDSDTSGRRESYPLSIASTSSSSSPEGSSTTRFYEKHYSISEDEEEEEYGSSESTGLLGFLALPRWKRDIEDKLSLPSTSRRRAIRTKNRAQTSTMFVPIFGIVLLGGAILTGIYVYSQRSGSIDESTYITASDQQNNSSTEQHTSPPQWAVDAQEIPDDPTHILIPPHETPNIELLRPLHGRLPYDVLESYFSTGVIHSSFNSHSHLAKQQPMDIVYLFVNASSPFLQENMLLAEESEGIELVGKKRHWRDNGELRGALRSGIKSFGDNLGKVHVISADWDLTNEDKSALEIEDGKIGQIPEWLNWDSQRGESSVLKWHFHSDVFKLPINSNGQVTVRPNLSQDEEDADPSKNEEEEEVEENEDESDGDGNDEEEGIVKPQPEVRFEPPTPVEVFWNNEQEWKELATPNFNSFAIESRMSWLQDVSENFIAFNDDMFVLRNLSTSDFRHPLLGNVFRMDSNLLVNPSMTPMQLTDSGEWGALQHANQILSKRFPARRRMYLHHLPKIQSTSMMNEALTMFNEELSISTTRNFRESKRGRGDVEMAWLTTNLRIERWREALLWSYIVAKVGHQNEGTWNNDARADLINLMQITDDQISGYQNVVVERRNDRKTLADSFEADSQVDWEGPKASIYQFSSLDGHLNLISEIPNRKCIFSLQQCLPARFFLDPDISYSSEEIFKHIAFAEPSCGDCLISALINESGERGIEAFLPSHDQIHYPASLNRTVEREWKISEPILQLTDSWAESDFTIGGNVFEGQDIWAGALARKDGGVELRRWCIKLLSRYTYVFASTPSLFSPIHNYGQLKSALRQVEETPDLAMFCINDDQYDSSDGKVRRLFGSWMNEKFGGAIPGVTYEREGVEWAESLPADSERSIVEEEERLTSSNRAIASSGNNHMGHNRILQKSSVLNDGERPYYNDFDEYDEEERDDLNEYGWKLGVVEDIPDAIW
ncbi:hypothetical protein I302_100323 [Kwoniella bestiolae CBS 10118]|uniref:Stealth protein CR3 conserved region 3 domain-containing protein n=1 Tax=Kwoniella bestiolae CBS 10118 TaxID=1296100 RepID=A0A1B9G4U3_9TREE|nr:hypothetical protein I302_03695 [Kwoniella bestiolae CBS 10118]OCF26018.1 hypothetical protein I302_03695 [Kwoniella bestiolae CBS 10118]